MTITLTKQPSLVRSLQIPRELDLSPDIISAEGAVLIAKALSHDTAHNVFEHADGRLGRLIEGDIIPVVLGTRQAMKEYSCVVPETVQVGDELGFMCESGLVGEIRGYNEHWGTPMKVQILGAALKDGKHIRMSDASYPFKQSLPTFKPLIGIVGTAMDTGKTTIITKIARHFRQTGKKLAGIKATGVGFLQDPLNMQDAGLSPVLSFMDMGIPSTCTDADTAIRSTLGLLDHITQNADPDGIIVEFGDGIIGQYHVADILTHPDIQKNLRVLIVTATDYVSVWGAHKILKEHGLSIDIVSGPVANNQASTQFIKDQFALEAESNLHAIPAIISSVERVLS